MSPLRSRVPYLGIIGALIMLPLAALVSPANAAISGTRAPHVSAAHVSAAPGPARGKHIIRQPVSPRVTGVGGRSGTATAYNWDGYSVLNSSGTNTNSLNKVYAQWTEPAITCDPYNSRDEIAAFWVGLDGWLSNTVEQGGTEAECINGTASYNAWWEMYPYNNVISEFSVNAGDVIQASVTYDTTTSEFDIVVKDVTSNQTLNQDIPCQSTEPACERSSAEVISEDPSGGVDQDGLFYLPNYGSATFTNASVTDVNGHTGSLNDPSWSNVAVTEVSSAGITKQTVGPLSTDGTSFSTTWQAESGAPAQVVNGGFEDGGLDLWACQHGDAIVTSPVHSGSYAVQISPTASQTGECDQMVMLSPNTSYTLTGWVQGNFAYLGVSGGATASRWASSSGWTQLTVPFTTGSSGAVTIYAHGWYSEGNVFADDISLS